MHYHSATTRHFFSISALLLVVTLLFAQYLGLAHRIEHVHPAQTLQQQIQVKLSDSVASTRTYDKGLEHSCALFDAAALAAVLHSPVVSLPILPSIKVFGLWQAFASWDAPVLLHFSTRAPPHA